MKKIYIFACVALFGITSLVQCDDDRDYERLIDSKKRECKEYARDFAILEHEMSKNPSGLGNFVWTLSALATQHNFNRCLCDLVVLDKEERAENRRETLENSPGDELCDAQCQELLQSATKKSLKNLMNHVKSSKNKEFKEKMNTVDMIVRVSDFYENEKAIK